LFYAKDFKKPLKDNRIIELEEYTDYMINLRYTNEEDNPYIVPDLKYCYDFDGKKIDCKQICRYTDADGNKLNECKEICLKKVKMNSFFSNYCFYDEFNELKSDRFIKKLKFFSDVDSYC